jgi:hypothetical protein
MKYFYYCILVLLVGCQGCKEKIDPCKSLKPVSASFKTRAAVLNEDDWKGIFLDIPSDTIKENGEFTADELDAISYTWKVGSGVYQGKKLSLGFGNLAPGTIVPVKLIVNKTPNKNCFPSDDGIDSVTKNITITRGQIEGGAIAFLRATYEMPDYDDPSKTIQFGTYQEENSEKVRGFGFPKEAQKGDRFSNIMGSISTSIQLCYTVSSESHFSTIRLIYKGGNTFDFYGEFFPIINGKAREDLVRKYQTLARKI